MIPADKVPDIITYLENVSSILLLRTDDDGTIIDVNSYASTLLGDDVVHMHFSDILAQVHKEGIDLHNLVEGDYPAPVSVSTASGMPQTLYVSAWCTSEGHLIAGETSVKEYEAVRKQMIQLTNEYAALTRDLQKKKKMLELLLDEKNRFIGMAAHDLRNPLTVIMSYAELLGDEKNMSDGGMMIREKILTSVIHMHDLVSDLLDLTAVTASNVVLKLEEADIRKLASECIAANSLVAQKKGITIKTGRLPRTPLTALIDPSKIETAFSNIVSNAIKYSNTGTTILVDLVEQDGGISFSVTDHGIGMDESELSNLFTPFATKGKGTAGERSTGLGLAITKRIVESHGGSINASSRKGDGSTFTITLPRER